MAKIQLTPELERAQEKIRLAKKVAKVVENLDAASANDVLDLARRDPLADAEASGDTSGQ